MEPTKDYTRFLKWVSCPKCDGRYYTGAFVELDKCKKCGGRIALLRGSIGFFGGDESWCELGRTW